MSFDRKGYSRIYVEKLEDIEKTKQLMLKINEDEVNNYMPEDLITVWNGEIELVYNGKFEMDRDKLTVAMWKAGIKGFCLSQSGYVDFPQHFDEYEIES